MAPHTSTARTTPTVGSVLAAATESLAAVSVDDARLEAEVLLARALQTDRPHLLARLRDPVTSDQLIEFHASIARRLAHEPLAYITGVREFYGIEIECTPAALIPRPETELLVDIALEAIRGRDVRMSVADVGTGTGAVAIAIATHAPDALIAALDPSIAAVDVARRNAARLGVASRIDFRIADLLDGAGTFDVVVANLPYIPSSDWRRLPPEIRDHEPRSALVGGMQGTELIERLIDQAPAHLAPQGVLALELGPAQAAPMRARAAQTFDRAVCSIEKDLAGNDRALVVRAR